jgi:two-component system KDP operon response regulator KdpE
MPNMNGIELCRNLRRVSQVPILVLSVRGEERSKVEALDSGADDYITKPFSTGELLARVRAALRRAPPVSETKTKIEEGDFSIDLEARLVTVAGREIRLTPKEFEVLIYMAQHPHKVLTHRAILNAVWGSNSMEQNEYLRVFVGQLRKKLEADASTPKYIVTEPWVGYRFEPGE